VIELESQHVAEAADRPVQVGDDHPHVVDPADVHPASSATTRAGAPFSPATRIGKAMTVNPSAGSSGRRIRFSISRTSAPRSTTWFGKGLARSTAKSGPTPAGAAAAAA